MNSCYIGLLHNDTIKYMSCSNDGCLAMAGVMLQLGYTSVEKIRLLLCLGHIERLGYNVEAPRKFKNVGDARECYKNCIQHTKTTFTLAYARDLQDKNNINRVRECRKEDFSFKAEYGYVYDINSKCWFVYVHGSKAYILQKLLTDAEYFKAFKQEVRSIDGWSTVSGIYAETQNELRNTGKNSIISTYNAWLVHNTGAASSNLEFDYAVRDGKRIYALYKKADTGKNRRKVVQYSTCIGDLVCYLMKNYYDNRK